MTRRDLVALMVGHDVEEHPDHASLAAGETALSVRNLTVRDSGQGRPAVDDVSFDVAHGELLVLTGLIGAGCSEVLRAIWGGLPGRTAGEIRIDGLPVRIANPRQAMAHGLGYVPGDRKEEGLILSMSAAHNLTLAVLRRLSRWLAIDEGREAGIVDRLFGRLRVRAAHPGVIVGTLSGGNQQKIAIGKWLATSPEVLLLDQPTRGIDIGARAEIYALLRELAEQGMAVVVAAADLTEALGLGDRIIVMGGGRIAGELARGEATQDRIIALASEEPARAGEE
ncbi:MAG: sugar ABC transporter ATP-binding protein [Thermomicrobiales bacterium]|nr:sugar ABC transporter ATP-binding protein [Thermomicrobiales bacterium]